jgi:hypothetical protein
LKATHQVDDLGSDLQGQLVENVIRLVRFGFRSSGGNFRLNKNAGNLNFMRRMEQDGSLGSSMYDLAEDNPEKGQHFFVEKNAICTTV